eukprot:4332744-Prymnesium_polylepis.1
MYKANESCVLSSSRRNQLTPKKKNPVTGRAHVVASTYAPHLATSGRQWSPVWSPVVGRQSVASQSPARLSPDRLGSNMVMDRRPAIYGHCVAGCGQSMVGMAMRHRYSRYSRFIQPAASDTHAACGVVDVRADEGADGESVRDVGGGSGKPRPVP